MSKELTWQEVWHKGFVPCLTIEGLNALRDAILKNDHRLIQGRTVQPPCVLDLPVEGACAIGYSLWMGCAEEPDNIRVDELFGKACFACDEALGEKAACRHFLNQFDEWTRDDMRRELLPEVEKAIASKAY